MSSAEKSLDASSNDLNARAESLARDLMESFHQDRFESVSPSVIQALAAVVTKIYAAQQEAGAAYPMLSRQDNVTGTDVMIACSALLKAADLQVFELGMWSSWTGR